MTDSKTSGRKEVRKRCLMKEPQRKGKPRITDVTQSVTSCLSSHVKLCTAVRVSILPYSSPIHKSFSSEIPICEVITWFQSYSGPNGPLPQHFPFVIAS